MALTKEQSIDKIEIGKNGTVQVRQATQIVENGNVLTTTYHRWTLEPGQDISEFDDRVKSVCNAVWTPEVIAAYEQQKSASLAAVAPAQPE